MALRFNLTALSTLLAAAVCPAQLRVLEYNVTNYSSGRVNEFQTILFSEFQGRSARPDVIVGQEFLSQAGVTNFLTILNTAPGSPGDYAAAPFVDGPDTDSAFFYRTSKVTFQQAVVVAVGGNTPNHPRNIMRYDIRLAGYTSTGASLSVYSSHMKANMTSDDLARRLLEAQRIRDNAETLGDRPFLLGADLNIQNSNQAAYVELVGSQSNNAGRFFDPISTPGDWNNNIAFRYVLTQDPSTQMDDRLDQILLCASLRDGDGFDYIGNPTLPYSTTTWNDPNHSYRAWGNDGGSFDAPLRVSGNTMVGPTIAQALIDSALGNGHLPVFLDLRVPPKVDSPTSINFGVVTQGNTVARRLRVTNSADVAKWSANGIASLRYSLSSTAGAFVPGGQFLAGAGISNEHVVLLDTATPGQKTATVTIASNAPDQPSRQVTVTGFVLARGLGGGMIDP
jgi:hypothetical protein